MPEHTTLLIHCYTKQQSDEAFHQFLGLDKDSDVSVPATERIDVSCAVRALRDAHYSDEALELSKREGDHTMYLQILLEDGGEDGGSGGSSGEEARRRRACDALTYIRRLSFAEAEETLYAHAKNLVASAVHETTSMLMEICSKNFGPSNESSDAEVYLPAYLDYSDRDRKFSHHIELRRFLWHVVGEGTATVKVWNTLLELCLHVATERSLKTTQPSSGNGSDGGSGGGSGGKSGEASIEVMKILKDPNAKYDPDQALVLVQRHGFAAGQLYLYEKRKMCVHIFSSFFFFPSSFSFSFSFFSLC